MVDAIPYDSMSYIKYKKDMHAPAALLRPFRLFGFKLSIISFRRHNLFDEFF